MAPNFTKKHVHLSERSTIAWRVAQAAFWLVGATILTCLLCFPAIGIVLFWDMLIPVAPALLVIAPGLWRNVCPLATTNLMPGRLGLSKRKKLTAKQSGIFGLLAVVALYLIVPLRHAVFNTNGPATAMLIIAMAVTGVSLGFFYEWKSAWCSGLCPIHPVEKLYGANVFLTVPNAQCDKCMHCVAPCPDSTANLNPGSSKKTIWNRASALLITGGLPGFIWGWFHVPDAASITSISSFFSVYEMPMAGLVFTLAMYSFLSAIIPNKYERKQSGLFAAAAVSCYYWYRIPALFGFGSWGRDGLLVDLSKILSAWAITGITLALTIFFFYRLFIAEKNRKSWLFRPVKVGVKA